MSKKYCNNVSGEKTEGLKKTAYLAKMNAVMVITIEGFIISDDLQASSTRHSNKKFISKTDHDDTQAAAFSSHSMP